MSFLILYDRKEIEKGIEQNGLSKLGKVMSFSSL